MLLNILKIYKKANTLNNMISKDIGLDVIFIYKRASNILINEINKNNLEISDIADPGLKMTLKKNYIKKFMILEKNFQALVEKMIIKVYW